MKSGFVNIIGYPNAGKSTLFNTFFPKKLAIATHKAQTTVNRIKGIINKSNDYQIILSDLPGYLDHPVNLFHEKLNILIKQAIEDADLTICLLDSTKPIPAQFETLYQLITPNNNCLVLINKLDLINLELKNAIENYFKTNFPDLKTYFISILKPEHPLKFLDIILPFIPEHPPYFPDNDDISDLPQKFFIAQLIRENIFLLLHQELPYECFVHIESFKETPKITSIKALIYVNKDSQKSILIGKAGSMIKKLSTQSRINIEAHLGTKVFLELFIKVKENWKKESTILDKIIY
ncbi:MAG: GTPase Era [Alphaproteobacteria bacterium]|nr:GTPase Era [Alphaproteobacteria bacterium]